MLNEIYNKKINKNLYLLCFIIPFFVCFFVSSLPTFNLELINRGINFTSHTLRIKGIWWSIQNKIFPHYINAISNDFYGDADPIGYPYLFLYILYNYISISAAYNIYNMIINIITYLFMYYATYYIFKNKISAVVSAVFFTLFNYRLYDIYELSRIGEYTALAFYPLAIAGLYNIFFDDKKKWWLLTTSILGALFSHIISFYYLIILIIFLSIICITIKIIKNKNINCILYFIKASVYSILLSLWFIVPFLEYYTEKELTFSNMGKDKLSTNLLNLLIHQKNSEFMISNISIADIIVIILIIFIIVYSIIKIQNDYKLINRLNIEYFIAAISFFIIYIYYYLASLNVLYLQKINLFNSIYSKQQFSFREIGRGGVFLSFSIGYFLTAFFDGLNIKKIKKIGPVIIILLISTISSLEYILNKLDDRAIYNSISLISLPDYQFISSEENMNYSNLVENRMENDDILFINKNKFNNDKIFKNYQITNLRREYLSICFDYNKIYNNNDNEATKIILPINAYTGYKFYDNNINKDFVREKGLPIIYLTENRGHVIFRFENNIKWIISAMISYILLFIIIIKKIIIEINNLKR